MASINISEDDFTTVAGAAMQALETGNVEQAKKLDKIARKINAALSRNLVPPSLSFSRNKNLSWEEVPSVLNTTLEE